MPLPAMFEGRLTVPAIAAPMFLVSNPDLVVATCRAGVIGTFPTLNQRSTEGYEAWLQEITDRRARAEREGPRRPAPFGVNLIVNKSNPRVEADLAVTVKHRVPLVITSLGAVKELVTQVQGLVFHDVINIRHARKAAEAGVDGIIAVCAGAGGHAGTLSPFALLPEIRRFFPKTLVLSGALSIGAGRALQGQPLWQINDQDASRRAPAHGPSGHAWQHSDEALFHITKYGRFDSTPQDQPSSMPAFKDILTDDQILAIIAFIKRRWPIGLRACQAMLNPGYAGMPLEASRLAWKFPPTCRATLQRSTWSPQAASSLDPVTGRDPAQSGPGFSVEGLDRKP